MFCKFLVSSFNFFKLILPIQYVHQLTFLIIAVLFSLLDHFLPITKTKKRSRKEKEYEALIKLDLAKIIPGLGSNGAAIDLTGDEAKKAEEIMKKEAFNLLASNKVAYDRTVKDARHPL